MASQAEIDQFHTSWQQTAQWAQSKGIKYNQYYPVYQLDSQRLLQYGSNGAMSTAERERAIIAASDPQAATQATPSTAANPSNIIGNTITDARNIFTGLGDIVIHPLHNGLVDSVKNTFDLMDGSHKLQGNSPGAKLGDALTSTVLSWIPGMQDIGEGFIANAASKDPFAAVDVLTEHPLQSILDVLPLANKLAALKVAGDAGFAERVGMVPEESASSLLKPSKALMDGGDVAKRISLGRVAKGYILNTKLGELSPEGELLKGMLNPQTGELATIGDRFRSMTAGSMFNLSPTIADVMGGAGKILNQYSNDMRWMYADLDEATDKMTEEQKAQMVNVLYQSQKVGLDKAMEDVADPRVVSAIQAWLEQNQWIHEESLNRADGPVKIFNVRTGQYGYFSLKGHAETIAARDAAQDAETDLLPAMPGMERLSAQTQQAGQFVDQSVQGLGQANQAARQVHVEGNVSRLLHGQKRFPTGIAKARVAKAMFGTGGWIDRLIAKAKAGEYETVAELAQSTLKRFDQWDRNKVGTGEEDPPEFLAVRQQVEALGKSAEALVKARKEASKAINGRVKEEAAETASRDALHKAQSQAINRTQKVERNKLVKAQKDDLSRLHQASLNKVQEIATRYAKQRADREHTLEDGNRNIDETFDLALNKAKNDNLATRAIWQETSRARGLSEAPQIAPGAAGSPEALEAVQRTLEAQREAQKAQLVASLPSVAELDAKEEAERSIAAQTETEMTAQLKKAQKADAAALQARQAQERDAFDAENAGKPARDGKFAQLVQNYLKTQDDFSNALFDHPSDNYEPIWFDLFAKNLVEDYRAKDSLSYKAKVMAGAGEDHLEQLRKNQQVMATLVQLGIHDSMDDPIFDDLDRGLIAHAMNSADKNLDDLAKNGLNPMWIHHVSSTQIENDAKGSAGIRLVVGHGEPRPDVLKPRAWGFNNSKFDIQAAIDHPTRQFLNNAAMRDFADTYLAPHQLTAETIRDTVLTRFRSDVVSLHGQGVRDFFTEKMKDMNLVEWDPEALRITHTAKWEEGKVYLDKDLARAVEKISSGEGFLKGGLIEKGTKLFRYSILGLSPRYTAHIVFGGTMLLGLREPLFFRQIPAMLEMMKTGQVPEDSLTTATNMGTTDWQMMSKSQKLWHWHTQGGKDTAHYLGQADLAKKGLDWKKASPIQWAKSLADINLRFTSTVVHMQRTLALLEGASREEKKGFYEDDTGNMVQMTRERAAYEGMKNAERVMGDLRRMSPFERDVARTVMPFYGWQKHILNYVLTFPADHPWRAMMLANMAEYDTTHTPAGLPSRYQFLFFLGTPDSQGNVTAIDMRAVNPLRDVANYATWGGLIGSLNPVFSAAAASIDPQIIYGGNTIYPNLTYDQFYGIEEAGPQGNLLTGAEQIVPQISAMQSALQIAGQRQGMSDTALLKNIGESLNFPWAPQHLNLRQEAAKTAMAQYEVTKSLATNAWDTGDFQPISDLGSVPDPRNDDYETPVSELEQLYNQLAQEYPGQPPSTTAPDLPSVTL
jgi:hypothetical protein